MNLYDKVKIIKTNIIGTIIDISGEGSNAVYTIESDVPELSEGYGGKWKIFDCRIDEIEVL